MSRCSHSHLLMTTSSSWLIRDSRFHLVRAFTLGVLSRARCYLQLRDQQDKAHCKVGLRSGRWAIMRLCCVAIYKRFNFTFGKQITDTFHALIQPGSFVHPVTGQSVRCIFFCLMLCSLVSSTQQTSTSTSTSTSGPSTSTSTSILNLQVPVPVPVHNLQVPVPVQVLCINYRHSVTLQLHKVKVVVSFIFRKRTDRTNELQTQSVVKHHQSDLLVSTPYQTWIKDLLVQDQDWNQDLLI